MLSFIKINKTANKVEIKISVEPGENKNTSKYKLYTFPESIVWKNCIVPMKMNNKPIPKCFLDAYNPKIIKPTIKVSKSKYINESISQI